MPEYQVKTTLKFSVSTDVTADSEDAAEALAFREQLKRFGDKLVSSMADDPDFLMGESEVIVEYEDDETENFN